MSTKIEQLRKSTEQETEMILDQYGKCCIVRPTGFGKTGLLTKFIKKYHHIVYLYPTDSVKNSAFAFYYGRGTDKEEIPGVTFISFMKLVMMKDKDFEDLKDTDLIIADEAHKLGATKTLKAMNKLLDIAPNAKLLGATASPERMDLIDEISEFFDNRVTSKYTLHNAFQDKILQKPYYCYCTYSGEDIAQAEYDTKLEIDKMSPEDRGPAYDLLKAKLIEISNLAKMENVVKETCDKYAHNTSYMKFITFFYSYEHLHSKSKDAIEWFQKAYPDHTIRTLEVTRETAKSSENLSQIDNFSYQANTIDIIFCVDMLNMSYHVNDLTGIIMYRGTTSGTIYIQQLGRVLSTGNTIPGIVFDVVDNLHREALYGVLGRKKRKTSKKRDELARLTDKINKQIDAEQNGIELPEEDKVTDQDLIQYGGLLNTFSNDNHVDGPVDRWWLDPNDIHPEDLITTGHEATYRQLIAKTVAEPISMRCRQAWARWIEKGGDANPPTYEHIMGQQAPDHTPLSPFAKLKQVSVQAVLDTMGVKNE